MIERVDQEAEVDAMITAWTQQRDKHEAMRILGAAGVRAGAVLDTQELHDEESFERCGICR